MWKKVEEERPPEDEKVLCWNPNTEYPTQMGMRFEAGASLGMSIDYGWRRNVTHWMPLPPKPLTEQEEEFQWNNPLIL